MGRSLPAPLRLLPSIHFSRSLNLEQLLALLVGWIPVPVLQPHHVVTNSSKLPFLFQYTFVVCQLYLCGRVLYHQSWAGDSAPSTPALLQTLLLKQLIRVGETLLRSFHFHPRRLPLRIRRYSRALHILHLH